MRYIFKGEIRLRKYRYYEHFAPSGFSCNYPHEDCVGIVAEECHTKEWETIASSSAIGVKLCKGDIVNIKNEEIEIVDVVFTLDGNAIVYTNKIIEVIEDEESEKEAERIKKEREEEIEQRKLELEQNKNKKKSWKDFWK